MSLRQLMHERGEELLGEGIYTGPGQRFPLLLKFIDAQDLLSVQVHPDHEYARVHDPDEGGKCEAWLVIDARPDSRIIRGVRSGVDEAVFSQALNQGEVAGLLNEFPVCAGDVIFIPPGTVHAIKPGVVLFEVQETSDATYRIYDWGRVDNAGKARPLHIEKALDVVRLASDEANKAVPRRQPTDSGKRWELVSCERFRMERLELAAALVELTQGRFFTLTALAGEGLLASPDSLWDAVKLEKGDTVLVPAVANAVLIDPLKPLTLVKTSLPRNGVPHR